MHRYGDMLNDVLVFLKNRLNMQLSLGMNPDDSQEDQVVFPLGQTTDSLNFKLGAVSILLANLEQENTLRPPDLYMRAQPDGTTQRVQPEIRLNLYVLFVANYQQYEDALSNLSAVIQYFQNQRLFTHQNTPELSDNIEQLVIELITQSFSELNEVWGALRLPYQPSLLYKVKMVVYQGDVADGTPAEIGEKVIRASS
jgi:Pvc16 N-terminal domain